MSKRSSITNALVDLFNDNLDGISPYTANIYGNTINKIIFWDEVNSYPLISVVAGAEARQYLPSNFKWGYLNISIKIFVDEENARDVLEQFFEDIETLLDANNELIYDSDNNYTTELISILSIDTDQGLLDPLAVGEITIQIQYDL